MDKTSGPWRGIFRWVLFGAAALLFINVLRAADFGAVYRLLKSLGPGLALALLPYFGVVFFECAGWRVLIQLLAGPVHWTRLLKVRLATEVTYRVIPGGALLAETLKAVLLNRNSRATISESTATVALMKVLVVASHGVYVGIALLLDFGDFARISQQLVGSPFLPWLTLATSLGMIVGGWLMGALMLHGSVATRLHRLLLKIPGNRLRLWLMSKEASFLATDQHSVDLLRARKQPLIASTFYFLLSWFAESVESFLMLKLLGAPLSFLGVFVLESVISVLRSLTFFLPGSLGVQDFSYIAFLNAFGTPNSTNLGAAFVLLKRLKELFWVAVGLGASTPASTPA